MSQISHLPQVIWWKSARARTDEISGRVVESQWVDAMVAIEARQRIKAPAPLNIRDKLKAVDGGVGPLVDFEEGAVVVHNGDCGEQRSGVVSKGYSSLGMFCSPVDARVVSSGVAREKLRQGHIVLELCGLRREVEERRKRRLLLRVVRVPEVIGDFSILRGAIPGESDSGAGIGVLGIVLCQVS